MQTIHGWPVIPAGEDDRLHLFTIPGTRTRTARLRWDVGGYLVAFAADYHTRIARLDTGTWDEWAWCPPRTGRASTVWSDHCGGVALDLNATREGSQGSSSLTFWRDPVHAVKLRRLRARYPLLEWGGDYRTFRDPMHWTFKYGVTIGQVRTAMHHAGIADDGTR